MDLEGFFTAVCRLLAVVLIVVLLLPLSEGSFIAFLWDGIESHGYRFQHDLTTALFFICAYAIPIAIMWFKAPWLARKITGGVTTDITSPRSRDIEQVAFGLVGLYLSASASYQLLSLGVLYLWRHMRASYMYVPVRIDPERVLDAGIMPAIGLWLLLGSRRLRAWLRLLRGRA